MNDLISRQAAIDGLDGHRDERRHLNDWQVGWNEALDWVQDIYLEDLPSVHPEKCSDILDELKADDYYNYIHTGYSRFSEDDWDYLIHNAKEKEKLHERLDIKTDGD